MCAPTLRRGRKKVSMTPSMQPTALTARAGRILKRFGMSLLYPAGDGMLDWYEVAGTAMDVAGEAWEAAAVGPDTAAEFDAYVAEVGPRVAEFTQLRLAKPLSAPVVLNRSEWIATITQSLKPLIETVLSGVYRSVLPEGDGVRASRFIRAATTQEVGLIIGYLAGRVLGQYDVAFMAPDGAPGALYFIHPNIVEAEERLGIEPRTFRRWLALHEVTHGFQFEANEWLKGHLKGLVEEQARYIEAKLARAAEKAGAEKVSLDWLVKLAYARPVRELISPEENPVLARTQSLMSILEGYSEYVMEAAGPEIVAGGRGIADLLDQARRTRSVVRRLIERLIGLEIKMEQYRLGYLFIKKAAGVGGIGLANMVWRGPENMPTLTELRHPELWFTRMLK